MQDYDFVIALAGNPNTGKSTIFNNLTGLRQHTGNWPGKTVTRAEGGFSYRENKYKVVDLPGTYSLLSASTDEQVARDFILFAKPDVTVIVADATILERNLNLALQILEITDRAILCVNLMDEAKRQGITVDIRGLSKKLGIPVIPMVARHKKGSEELLQMIEEVATGKYICKPHKINYRSKELHTAIERLSRQIPTVFPHLPNVKWVAMRLLEGDQSITEAIRSGDLSGLTGTPESASEKKDEKSLKAILSLSNQLRWELGDNLHDKLLASIYSDAGTIADKTVTKKGKTAQFDFDIKLDKIVTGKWTGIPIMFALLALVFWLTIIGANYPSKLLANLLIDTMHPLLKNLSTAIGLPWWLDGVLIDGAYLSGAWVVSVMLPPMAIFFPLFTLLEDFGYLPRVAFNLDKLFRKAGAHGKQALTMSMGFGCNAAGVVATRIIDSPRERLIAIITNNFSLCNGRWPTIILIAGIFIGTQVPAHWAGIVTAGTVIGITVFGIFMSFVVSWFLSRTVLKGTASSFSLELPPYRPPNLWQVLYRSIIDRTLIVLWRAIIFAIPAGILIWSVANIHFGALTLAEHIINGLEPFALLIGLNGVILLAYIIAIPANEIVIPTILMLTVISAHIYPGTAGNGVMFELDATGTAALLKAGGWTTLTAVNLMLFSLLHNPCSTTIFTIYKETKSLKWTLLATFLPLAMGIWLTFIVTQIWRLWSQ